MATLNPSTASVGSLSAGPIEQLLVMHCLKEDSVMGREGFSVRAASPGATDPSTLDWALRLDSYELPLDMKSGALLANQAPRRLARVPGPAGRVALVHTSYLPEDTVGRSHSFISHILLLPEVETIQAATAWGSSDWQTDEYPRGETKSLSPLDRLPHGDLIDDAALTAFLSDGASPADQSLARSIYPGRVESKPDARRRWIRGALHGFLRTGEANAVRNRVCILAEPGAVALLVYAIARLLPPQIVGTFPFSTYEPPHSSLRENKVARVIGSYARNGIDRADSDALRRRAYVVDTLRDAYGPELFIEPSWPLEGLLKLVADGNWTAVNEIRDLWLRDPQVAQAATPELLAQAIRVRPLAASLKSGTIDVDGLVELRRNRFGEGLLHDDELRRRAWEAVRKVWTRPKVRDDFAELLREHLDELLAEVRKRVPAEPASAWRADWEVLKPLVQDDQRAGCFAMLLEAMGATPAAALFPPEGRAGLMREWSQSAHAGAAIPVGIHWLLRAADPAGFRALVRSSGLDPRHAGLAACLMLSGSAGWQPDLGLLVDLTDDQFRAFLAELERFDRSAAVLERLRSDRKLAETLVDRVRRTRPKVGPAWIEELLLAVRCDEPAWRDYWLKNKHFHEILSFLDTESRESRLSRRLWVLVVESITVDNYDESQLSPVLESLAGLSDQFPRSLPSEHAERLKGWNTLSIHFASPPKSPDSGTAAKLRTACKAVGQAPETLAEWWFDKWVVRARTDLERAKKNGALGRAILGFVESEDQACEIALKLAARVPDFDRRRECKTDLFNTIVSEGNKDRFAEKYERELRDTSIRPRLRLRDSVGGRGGGKKGLGVGQLRLPPKATPYVASFVGGGVFTALLMLLLAGAVDFGSTRWRSDPAEQIYVKEKALRDLQDELAERVRKLDLDQKDLDDRQKQLSKREQELENREKKPEITVANPAVKQADGTPVTPVQRSPDTAPTPSADQAGAEALIYPPRTVPGGSGRATTPGPAAPGGQTGAPGPMVSAAPTTLPGPSATVAGGEYEKTLNDLDSLIRKNPLPKEKVKEARDLARRLDGMPVERERGGAVRVLSRLLKGLSGNDVPEKPSGPFNPGTKYPTDNYKSDFVFLNSNKASKSVLATLSSRHLRACYAFETSDEQLNWTKIQSEQRIQYSFLSASPSGDFALAGQSSDPNRLIKIDINKFYDYYFAKPGQTDGFESVVTGVEFGAVPLPISNRGELYAVLTSGEMVPGVEIRRFDTGKPVFKLLLGRVANELRQGHFISKMSFDARSKTCTVALKGSESLLLFSLDGGATSKEPDKPPELTPEIVQASGTVIDWEYSFDGDALNIATVSDRDSKVWRYDLRRMEKPRNPDSTLIGRAGALINAVAASCSGTYLAVGYEDGVVMIHDLRHGNREVLRLGHEGPVLKLGFSPDRRVLAVLVQHGKENIRAGFIRLWVTENWERDEGK